MTISFDRMLSPRSIAVVGASTDPNSLGYKAIGVLDGYGFTGDVYPVHPRYEEVAGRRAYASVRDVPAGTDLAVIAVSAPRVAEVIEDCGAAGIPFAIVLTSGFGEVGGDGPKMQQELIDAGRRAGVRLLGPNTLGMLNATEGIAAGFGIGVPGRSKPRAGSLAIVSQSGGMGLSLINRATEAGLGISTFVATGNEADLTLVDFLETIVEDPSTTVIAVYAETIRDADRLIPIGRRAAELGKPIVVAKIGRSEAGGRAVRSHTGSLAGADSVYDEAFRMAGIIRVDDIEELFDLASFLVRGRIPRGNRVAVVTQSGGGGAWLADSLEHEGLELAATPESLRDELKAMVPDFGSVVNPVDLTASGISVDAFGSVIEALTRSGAYDAIVVLMPLLDNVDAEKIAGLASRTTLPLLGFTHWLPDPTLRNQVGSLAIPYVTSPYRAAKVLSAAAWYGRRSAQAVPDAVAPSTTSADAGAAHSDAAAFALLDAAGFPLVPWARADSRESAIEAAAELGVPIALKLSVDDLVHKSDVGGVHLGLVGADAVGAAYDSVAAVAASLGQPPRALIQAMAPTGVEVIVGSKVDPTFGPVVMVGLGGIYAELLGDVAIRLAPVGVDEARAMISELGLAGVLDGARGQARADIGALAETVSRLSVNAVAWKDTIAEIDLNPVLVLPEGEGVLLVDAAMIGVEEA
ncbi:MAG: acetate--CoA ligase family protein [Actinomycetota bacterium]